MMLDATAEPETHHIDMTIEGMLGWLASLKSPFHRPSVVFEGLGIWRVSFEGDIRQHRGTCLNTMLRRLVAEAQKDLHS